MVRTVFSGLLFGCLAFAQQVISVSNAAGVSGTAIAPGSIVNIQQMRSPVVIGTDPSRMSVRVQPVGSETAFSATVLPRGLGSIWALLPSDLPLGPADVSLVVDGQASSPARITVVRSSFGLFTNAGGFGSAVAQNIDSTGAVAVNQLTQPVLPGQYVALWGTGLGTVSERDVDVELGGTRVLPTYAGPAPGMPGVDQINFEVPADVPDGCYVSLVVRASRQASNEATLAKANAPGPCEHPFGLAEAALKALDAGQGMVFGAVSLRNDIGLSGRTEIAEGRFRQFGALEIESLAQPLKTDDRYFSCETVRGVPIWAMFASGGIDAGEFLTLTGPDKAIDLPKVLPAAGIYRADLAPAFLSRGLWRVSSTGGRSVEPFQAAMAVPPPIRWTNPSAVDRNQDQVVRWDPEGYAETDVATVTVSSNLFPQTVAGPTGVACRVPALSGSVTLPAELLRTIPASVAPGLATGTLRLEVGPRPNQRMVFPLALTTGERTAALFDYGFSETARLDIF